MLNGDIDVLELTGDITNVLSLEGNLLPIGPKGDKGDPGFSPVVTTSKSGKTTTVKFETATGNVYAYIQDGEDGQGSGDMMTDVYDQNKNGIVDNAEKVNNHTVEKDVPANADFSDTKAIWGNITGTLTNQTDLNTALGNKANTSDLSTVATSGSYNDLSNKPTNVSTFTNDANYVTSNGNAESTQTNVSSATFTNTLEAPMNIDLKGNTSQTGTPTPSSPIPINNVSGDNQVNVCGKNLFNGNNISSKTLGGITTNCSNSTIEMNGTTNIVEYIYTKQYITRLKAGTYTTSLFKNSGIYTANGGAIAFYIRKNDNTTLVAKEIAQINNATIDNPTSATFTLNEDTDIYFSMYCNKINQILNNFTFSIQIEDGETATTYEAYNGTTYNIDLPVENLFDKDNAEVGNGYINNDGDFAPSQQNKCIVSYTELKPNTKYTLTYNGLYRVILYDSSKTKTAAFPNVSSPYTFTTTNDTKYIRISGDSNINLDTIQLEQGSKANTFTPYGTTPIELNKIGTYQDYFYKQNDKWYLHKEIGKVVLNGSEDYITRGTTDTSNIYRWRITLDNPLPAKDASTNVPLYCNKLTNVSAADTYFRIQGFSISSGTSNYAFFFIDETKTYSLDNMKVWLSTNNLIVNYILATPTNTEITYTPLIEQLESIKNAMSKEGTTNVNQVNNDAPFMLDLSVFNDTYNGRYQSVLEMYKRLKEAE